MNYLFLGNFMVMVFVSDCVDDDGTGFDRTRTD